MTFPQIQTTPPPKRPRPASWFGNAFAVTAGIIAAIVVVPTVVTVVLFLAAVPLAEKGAALRQSNAAKTAQAKAYAMPELRKRGIVELSEETGIVEDGVDTTLVGFGRDGRRNLHRIMVKFRVARFNGRDHWKLLSVDVLDE